MIADKPPAPPAEADTIQPGNRLVRARGEGGQSLGERLLNQFYRLTWRTPLHSFRLRGRYPLKLLTVPADPVAGEVQRGEAILGGRLTWRGEVRAVADFDFATAGLSSSFASYLHGFGWLRDLAAAGDRATCAPVAEKLTRAWLDSHSAQVADPAWRGDLWGWRILNWAAHAPLILSSTDLVYRSAVLNTLARGARHLDRVADRAPVGVERIVAWCGVVAAGLLMPGGEPRRAFGEAGLERAIASGITVDGGSICRSPHGQLQAVAALSMLRAVYAARKTDMPDLFEATLSYAVPALLGITMGEGGLSSWQGAGAYSRDAVDRVVVASGARARPLRQARDWGYQRLVAGKTILVIDAAPPPVSRVTGAGCASTLAFELSDGDERLVVNCGGALMGGAHVSQKLADGLRTTAAHSSLTLADTNSTAIHSDGTLGKGVNEVELDRQDGEFGSRVDASHDGYVRRFGMVHKRSIAMDADGREIRCDDTLIPSGSRKRNDAISFAIRFHLGPRVEASPTADGQGALLRLDEGALWQFRCTGASFGLDGSIWIDGDGRPHATQQIVISGDAAPGGASVSWSFRRVG